MNAIARTLESLRIGKPRSFGGLTLYPLFGDTRDKTLPYLLLDEALAEGLVEVSEVSEGGRVPELALHNEADQPVLLLDGEELVGAKQNRVLNVTVLAPAHTRITLPVSCVEAGRWGWDAPDFRSSGRTQYARARARKVAQVSESLAMDMGYRSDQSAVWADIDAKAHSLGVDSATSAMADIYRAREEDVEAYVQALPTEPGQTGALFHLPRVGWSCDLFDHPATLAAQLPKIVRGQALDAIEVRPEGRKDQEPAPDPEHWLTRLAQCKPRTYPAVGLGETVRLSGPGLAGAALVVDDEVVHLYAGSTRGAWEAREVVMRRW